MNEPTFKELLDCINSGLENGKANCSIGLFINEYSRNAEAGHEDGKEIDSLILKKPIISIASFAENNEFYYDVKFHFRSYNDSDYKQMWKFLCRYAETAKREGDLLQGGESISKITALSISILPEIYRGKYFAYINMPFWECISAQENAFDKSAIISFLCNDESFEALMADEDMVDRRSIDREVEQEILAELEAYPNS